MPIKTLMPSSHDRLVRCNSPVLSQTSSGLDANQSPNTSSMVSGFRGVLVNEAT